MPKTARVVIVIGSIALLTTSCSDPEPGAVTDRWAVSSTSKNSYLFEASGSYTDPKSGVFHRQVETVDENGCKSLNYVGNEYEQNPAAQASAFNVKMPIKAKAKIARARFYIDFWSVEQSASESGTRVFDEEKVVDLSLKPPAFPNKPCNTSKVDLRKKAETDPEGADAEAIDSMSRNEVIATAINTAGYLCARVTDLYPRGGDIIASCVEYRNGKGRAKYRIDTADMTVTPI